MAYGFYMLCIANISDQVFPDLFGICLFDKCLKVVSFE